MSVVENARGHAMRAAIIALMLTVATQAGAGNMTDCAEIADNQNRLECYDQAIGRSIKKKSKKELHSSKFDSSDPVICRGMVLICYNHFEGNDPRYRLGELRDIEPIYSNYLTKPEQRRLQNWFGPQVKPYDEAKFFGEETICDSMTVADIERCSLGMMNILQKRRK